MMRTNCLLVLSALCGPLLACESETGPPAPLPAVAIQIIPGPNVVLAPGAWVRFRAEPVDTNGRHVGDLPNVTWASSDSARLPVDSLGVVTGKAVVVDAVISASLRVDGRVLLGTVRVSVIPRDASITSQ